MTSYTTTKQETRSALLQAGLSLMVVKGYTNTGIQEVLASIKVPKGSFYYYFDSKEHFALEIIREFAAEMNGELSRVLTNAEKTPVARLKSYCTDKTDALMSEGCRKGCLIGNLSQEMSDQSEVLREELGKVMNHKCELIAACIAEGQDAGEIRKDYTSRRLAEFFCASWAGAVMVAKTIKNTGPLDNFISLIFDDVLKP